MNDVSNESRERTIVAFSAYTLRDLCDSDFRERLTEAPTYKIRMAASDGRMGEVNELVRKKYEWRGYEVEGLVTQPNYITLTIYTDEKLIATMTLGVDSERGLSADDAFKIELDGIRFENKKISEITKFAIEDGHGSREIQASIIHITYIFARHVYACTDFVFEVHPRHVRFYERCLGFHMLGQEKYCSRVNAPSRLMHIDFDYIDNEIGRLGGTGSWGKANDDRSLYPYFFQKTDEEGIAAKLVKQYRGIKGAGVD